MVTQQQLISSLLTQPPVEVNAVGLILQIGCQRRLVMAQVSFWYKQRFYRTERRLLPMS